jgi:hypothetical protein
VRLKTLSSLLLSTAMLGAAPAPWPFPENRTVVSSHFIIHHENQFAPAGITGTLEGLRAKLLLDLRPLCPWAQNEPVHVFLYADADSYRSRAGANAWAGGHIAVAQRAIFVYEKDDLSRTLAHELGHLYFEKFFEGGKSGPPLWLNEGVATLMEWDYGLEKQASGVNRYVLRGPPIPLEEFMAFDYHDRGGDSDVVSLWYAQASTVARYLLRGFSARQFMLFCASLKDGRPVEKALRSGYDNLIPDAPTLDRLWRESLK